MRLKALAQIIIVVVTLGSSSAYANTPKDSTAPTTSLRTTFLCHQDAKSIPTSNTSTQRNRASVIKICLNSHWIGILTGLTPHQGFLSISLPQSSTQKDASIIQK